MRGLHSAFATLALLALLLLVPLPTRGQPAAPTAGNGTHNDTHPPAPPRPPDPGPDPPANRQDNLAGTWIVYILMTTLLALVMCSRGFLCQPRSLGPEHYLTRERGKEEGEEDLFTDDGLDSSSSSGSETEEDLDLAWQKEK